MKRTSERRKYSRDGFLWRNKLTVIGPTAMLKIYFTAYFCKKNTLLTFNRPSPMALLNACARATRPRWSEYKIRA